MERTSSSTPKDVVHYNVEGSPSHFQRVSMYLKQLRERHDKRSCDVIFLLEGGKQERLHSAVAGGHSSRLAKMLSTETKLPMLMDLSQYPAASVHLVVDWMYKGTADFHLQDLADHLVVSSDLRVVFLHRQLEQTLRQHSQKRLIAALNIATHPSTGISSSTIIDMVKIIVEREKKGDTLEKEKLQGLTLRSVIAIVSCRVKQADKLMLINVALNWLRLYHRHVDDVISSIIVMEMRECDLNAFRITLSSAMRNPNLRPSTYVSQKKGADWLDINVDRGVDGDLSASPLLSGIGSNDSSLEEQCSQSIGGEAYRTESEIQEIRALPSDNAIGFKQKKNSSSQRKPCSSFRGKQSRVSTSSLCSFTGSEGSTSSIPARKRSFTRSELHDIGNLPNILTDDADLVKNFVKWERQDDKVDYTPSEINSIVRLPDPFTLSKAPKRYTRSELDEIRSLPNVFSKKSLVDECADCEKQPSAGTKTAVSASNASPAVSTADTMSQETLEEARAMQLKTLGKRDLAADEQSDIRHLDVSFSKDNATPHRVNSTYANVPKTTTSSYYAF